MSATNEESLIAELKEFCAANNLPYESADDILALYELTAEQRAWLTDFCKRWDEAVK